MKKTVIKRRKRVPAVGTTGRNSPGGPSQSERDSPAPINAPMPQTATASGAPYPTPTESEKSHASPYGSAPPLHEPNRSPSIFDPIGMRRQQQQKAAVPLNLGNTGNNNNGTERKKPWWFDDSRNTPQPSEKDRVPKDKEREGVSLFSYGRCTPGWWKKRLPPWPSFAAPPDRTFDRWSSRSDVAGASYSNLCRSVIILSF